MPVFDATMVATYFQIIVINLVLSGDNIIVIGLAAAGLEPRLRGRAIFGGIIVATVIRIVFAAIAASLLAITGLLLAGGLLLLWVCWKMCRELRRAPGDAVEGGEAGSAEQPRGKTLGRAMLQIIVADVSMSLDNILAVAGAARTDMPALVFGLVTSVVLMGIASSLLARVLDRYKWLAWLGLLVIVYVALDMIWTGAGELAPLIG